MLIKAGARFVTNQDTVLLSVSPLHSGIFWVYCITAPIVPSQNLEYDIIFLQCIYFFKDFPQAHCPVSKLPHMDSAKKNIISSTSTEEDQFNPILSVEQERDEDLDVPEAEAETTEPGT